MIRTPYQPDDHEPDVAIIGQLGFVLAAGVLHIRCMLSDTHGVRDRTAWYGEGGRRRAPRTPRARGRRTPRSLAVTSTDETLPVRPYHMWSRRKADAVAPSSDTRWADLHHNDDEPDTR